MLIHILRRIFETLGSQVTWQKIIETTPVHSHETAANYIEHLEDSFLTFVLRCFDPAKQMAAPRKARKVYFIDPLLYPLVGGYLKGLQNNFDWWSKQLQSIPYRGKIFEAVVIGEFSRHATADLYYWYSAEQKREVDLLWRQPDNLRLYEMKNQIEKVPHALGQEVQVITPETFKQGIPR